MLKVTVLGSGSTGNATLVECGNTRLLIDAGFSAKKLKTALKGIGIDPATLTGILLTHEHIDHIQALPTLLKTYSIPVFTTLYTKENIQKETKHIHWKFFEIGTTFVLGETLITPFRISHDSQDPVGYRIDSPSGSYGHLSDTGTVTDESKQALKNVNILFLESNHDIDMLAADTHRPFHLKNRILSSIGHLSNKQASTFVQEIWHKDLRGLILGHLSKDCNTQSLALSNMNKALTPEQRETTAILCSEKDIPVSFEFIPSK